MNVLSLNHPSEQHAIMMQSRHSLCGCEHPSLQMQFSFLGGSTLPGVLPDLTIPRLSYDFPETPTRRHLHRRF